LAVVFVLNTFLDHCLHNDAIIVLLRSSRQCSLIYELLMWLVWLGSLTVTCKTCNPEVTQRRTRTLPGNDLKQVVHTHVPLSPSSIIWYWLHHWDVNRHTTWYTGPVSMVSQCKNCCLAWGL